MGILYDMVLGILNFQEIFTSDVLYSSVWKQPYKYFNQMF